MIAAWLLVGSVAHAAPCADASATAQATTSLTFVRDDGPPVVGATTRAVRHPGLPSERAFGIGVTDTRGRVDWKPDDGGPYRVVIDGHGACTVHVAYAAPPLRAALPVAWLAAGALLLLLLPPVAPRRTGARGR